MDIKDKDALLTHLSCSDALAWMHDVAKYTLAGKI
jgi:hypothetical protein